jgi:hypothetical protein
MNLKNTLIVQEAARCESIERAYFVRFPTDPSIYG